MEARVETARELNFMVLIFLFFLVSRATNVLFVCFCFFFRFFFGFPNPENCETTKTKKIFFLLFNFFFSVVLIKSGIMKGQDQKWSSLL